MEKPFKCKTCGKKFARLQNLKGHMLSHTHFKRYKCNKCDKKFVYLQALKEHLNIHNGIKPYKCDLCDKSFLRSMELKTHKNSTVHAGVKPWKCPKCKKRFAQQPHLTAHMRSHTGDKPFKCPMCPGSFTQSSHLNSHILLHTGEKPHQCKICKLSYRLKTTLNSHMRTHTGDRPYKCPHCPRAFTQQTPMAEHIRIVHGNIKLPCSGCYKVFQTTTQLKRHERSHLGPYKYSCLFCGRGQETLVDMWDHYRRHLKEKPYFCGYCDKSFYTAEDKGICEKRHKRYGQKLKTIKNSIDKDKVPEKTSAKDRFSHVAPMDDISCSFSPPLPQLIREGEPTSFEGVVSNSSKKDVNGNNEFSTVEDTAELEREKVGLDRNCHSYSVTSPSSSPPQEEIDESVTLSPPSLDFEGRQNEEDEMDEDSHEKAENKGEATEDLIKCPSCDKKFTVKAQLSSHLLIHRKGSKRSKRLTLRKKSSNPNRRMQTLKTQPVDGKDQPTRSQSTSGTLTQREKIQIKLEPLWDDSIATKIKSKFPVSNSHNNINESIPADLEVPLTISAYRKRKARRQAKRIKALERKALKRPFKCSQCQYSAQSKFSLELHVQLVHVGLEGHPCKFCWKTFPTNQCLDAHNLEEHKH